MNFTQIRLPEELKNELSSISESRYPEESCAILFGIIENKTPIISSVTKIVELENLTHSQVEFRWDDIEFYNQIVKYQQLVIS